jgi:hypothetical protein
MNKGHGKTTFDEDWANLILQARTFLALFFVVQLMEKTSLIFENFMTFKKLQKKILCFWGFIKLFKLDGLETSESHTDRRKYFLLFALS